MSSSFALKAPDAQPAERSGSDKLPSLIFKIKGDNVSELSNILFPSIVEFPNDVFLKSSRFIFRYIVNCELHQAQDAQIAIVTGAPTIKQILYRLLNFNDIKTTKLLQMLVRLLALLLHIVSLHEFSIWQHDWLAYFFV